MAIIAVSVSDALPKPYRWAMPPEGQSLLSPIPRGFVVYSGSDSIPLLGAGDETNYNLTLTMATGFAYLPRNLVIRYTSDDLVNQFDNLGQGIYIRPSVVPGNVGSGSAGLTPFNIESPGEINQTASLGTRIWTPPQGTPKLLLQGGDTLLLFLADMAGTSTAGDMEYWIDFYVFDVDQIDKWPIHTPTPVISHVSF